MLSHVPHAEPLAHLTDGQIARVVGDLESLGFCCNSCLHHSSGNCGSSKINWDNGWHIEMMATLCCVMMSRRSSLRPKKPGALPMPTSVIVVRTPCRSPMAFRGCTIRC